MRPGTGWIIGALAALALPGAAKAADCDGYPLSAASTAPGLCLGVVLEPAPGTKVSRRLVKMPRTLLQRPSGDWLVAYAIEARGLRNALALLRMPGGAMLAAENGVDLAGPRFPYDELVVLTPGADFGWPYCMDFSGAAPDWRAARALDCRSPAYSPPAALLPPHGAPLGMAFYAAGPMTSLQGRLLLGLHGYRGTGGRVLALAVDEEGRPLLSPVGVATAQDGSVWIADDVNGRILRLAASGR